MKTASLSLLLGVCVLLLSGPTVSEVSLDVRPNLQQFFSGASVSLSCSDDQQTVKRTRGGQTGGRVEQCGSGGFGVFNGSSCSILFLSESHSGVYWCETSSGQKSLQVNISVTTSVSGLVILEIPALPVMTGSDVTLSCSVKTGNIRKKTERALFFRNGTSLGSEPVSELKFSGVQQSDDGFYSCYIEGSARSPQSWLRVRDLPPLSPFRLFVHLLVFCPFFVSTGLMLSIYCSRDTGDKAAVSMEMDRSVGAAQGLDEDYDDVAADVTTVHEF